MINPTTIDILRTVDSNIEEKIVPSLKDLTGLSAMATVRHMLRHVMVRIETEGQSLFDDIASLRKLLPQVQSYLNSLDSPPAAAEAKKIGEALGKVYYDRGTYPSLILLSQEAGSLRECVYQALKYLQSIRAAQKGKASYDGVRAAIRDYIVFQMEEEEKIIAPAFYGRGPRR